MAKASAPDQQPYDRIVLRMHEKWPSRFPQNRKITQRQIAALAGVSQPSVTKWRRGGPIDRSNIVSLAMQLDVMTEWLETGRGPKFPGQANDPLLDEIWKLVSRMDEPQRMELTRYAAYLAGEAASKAG